MTVVLLHERRDFGHRRKIKRRDREKKGIYRLQEEITSDLQSMRKSDAERTPIPSLQCFARAAPANCLLKPAPFPFSAHSGLHED